MTLAMEMKCLEGTSLGLREQLPAEQPMAWHARGREGWLAPARVTMSTKNGGGKPTYPTTSMLLDRPDKISQRVELLAPD
jgi:hypothetical protein